MKLLIALIVAYNLLPPDLPEDDPIKMAIEKSLLIIGEMIKEDPVEAYKVIKALQFLLEILFNSL